MQAHSMKKLAQNQKLVKNTVTGWINSRPHEGNT
jgi:hypothetical protein